MIVFFHYIQVCEGEFVLFEVGAKACQQMALIKLLNDENRQQRNWKGEEES